VGSFVSPAFNEEATFYPYKGSSWASEEIQQGVTVTRTKTWTGKATVDAQGKIDLSLHLTFNEVRKGSEFQGKLIPNQVVVPTRECDLTASGFLRLVPSDIEHPKPDDGRRYRFEKLPYTHGYDPSMQAPWVHDPQYDPYLQVSDSTCRVTMQIWGDLRSSNFPMTFTVAGELQIKFPSDLHRIVVGETPVNGVRPVIDPGAPVTLLLRKAASLLAPSSAVPSAAKVTAPDPSASASSGR